MAISTFETLPASGFVPLSIAEFSL